MKSNFVIILLMRMTLAFVFLIGIIICLIWYPIDVTISSGIPFIDYNGTEITLEMNIEFYTKLFFYWGLSLPCFVIVVMGFIDTVYARKYGTFNIKSANILFKMTLILSGSSVVFIIGNVIFMLFGWNLSPLFFDVGGSKLVLSEGLLYCIVGGFGLLFSSGLYGAHKYIANGAAGRTEKSV